MSSAANHMLELADVKAITKLSRSTIYAKIKEGTFPAPKKVGAASRWSLRQIDDWVTRIFAEHDTPRAA